LGSAQHRLGARNRRHAASEFEFGGFSGVHHVG